MRTLGVRRHSVVWRMIVRGLAKSTRSDRIHGGGVCRWMYIVLRKKFDEE